MTLIDDLSAMTSIQTKTLNKLVDCSTYAILQSVEEMVVKQENKCEIDFTNFKLIILIDEDELMFKIIPSKDLEKALIKTISNKKNSMEPVLLNNMVDTLVRDYKELL